MNGDDLEVRRVALDSLFDILKKHGHSFRSDFWDTICQEVLFPIFAVLRSRNDVTRFSTHEDMSVWLSTTMIHALRNLIDLWTFYFDTLERLLPGLLDLLCACICQENDTLARIGTSCLQQLLEKNVERFSPLRWSQVVDTFVRLYQTTTAYQLFDPALRAGGATAPSRPETPDPVDGREGFSTPRPLDSLESSKGSRAATLSPPIAMSAQDRRRIFKQIIVKCVLQLLLIDTTNELLSNAAIYERVPPDQLLRLLNALQESHDFAKRFNANKELRMALWKVGFMKQLPNLLKQESSSAATLVAVLVKMHEDDRTTHKAARPAIRQRLVPLGEEIVSSFIPLDPETQARNITAWAPVVADVFRGVCTFEDEQVQDEQQDEVKRTFSYYASTFYPLAVDLIAKEQLSFEITLTLRTFLHKIGLAKGLYDPEREQRRRNSRAQSHGSPALRRVAAAPVNGHAPVAAAAHSIEQEQEQQQKPAVHRPEPLVFTARRPSEESVRAEQPTPATGGAAEAEEAKQEDAPAAPADGPAAETTADGSPEAKKEAEATPQENGDGKEEAPAESLVDL